MSEQPTGTITFLFTDIEGSTRLWERHPGAMRAALARHDALLRGAIEAQHGYVFKTIGDAFCAAFGSADAALDAALTAQRGLAAESWEETGKLRVRMALHTGEAEERDADYFGPTVNRVARLLSTGYGDQILLSLTTERAIRRREADGAQLLDLGKHRLKDLQLPEQIYQFVVPDLPAEFPPIKTLDRYAHNLPAQTTPLIGREAEVAAAREQLLKDDVRLLTLTGPGGTGKTRLSLQVAAEMLDDFADGAYFVPLAPINDAGLVVSTIAQALGVREIGDQPIAESLREHLRDQALLLVLDNFEQVMDATQIVSDLLRSCPKLKVLVTSRIVLRIYGEREFPVPPLGLPDLKRLPRLDDLAKYPSVDLFVQRSQAVKPGFALDRDSAAAVAAICVRLDGLPLAIELAAARSKILAPSAMLSRLDSRLKLLTSGARDLPARQQTLRGAIAWSYDLLDPPEQTLFSRLAVFVGGCTFESAETVCASDGSLEVDILDGLSSLVDKSLLRQVDQDDGETRFVMLETLREFALERLEEGGEAEALRAAHADYFLVLAEEADPKLEGAQQSEWLTRLELEHDNLRAVLGWGTDHNESEALMRMGGALWRFWRLRGYLSEGRTWLERALAARDDGPAAARAKALDGAGALAATQGDGEQAVALHTAALELWRQVGDKRGIARSLDDLGIVAHDHGDFGQATELHEQALALFREVGDRRGCARSLNNLGAVALYQGDNEQAEARFEESLSLCREVGDAHAVGNVLNSLGALAYMRENYEQAATFYEESLAVFRELEDKQHIALTLANLGDALRHQRDFERAVAHYDESLALCTDLGDKPGKAFALYSLGKVAQDQGDDILAVRQLIESIGLFQQIGDKVSIADCLEALAAIGVGRDQMAWAARVLGAAASIREAVGAPLPMAYQADYNRDLTAVRTGLTDEEFVAAWTEGKDAPVEQVISDAVQGVL